MSSTSPRDLVITFRSIPRRLREAQGDLPADGTARQTADVQAAIGEAGRLLSTAPDALSIADAIEAVPAHSWDATVLEQLRALALAVGAHLRDIAALDPDRE